MSQFMQKHARVTNFCLSGFDRVLFRGTLRGLSFLKGMIRHLSHKDVPRREFGAHVERTTKKLIASSLCEAEQLERPVVYLQSSNTRKESLVKQLLEEHPVDAGLICVLKCVEPCQTYEMFKNKETQQLELVYRRRKCMFLYHYFLDPRFGLMHARIQTWYPFPVHVCVNGRQFLARRMDEEHLAYTQYENCFPLLEDPQRAQHLLDELLRYDWTQFLHGYSAKVNPALSELVNPLANYYWTAPQTEFATDVSFTSPEALQRVYPQLIRGAITTFATPAVMRFLGKQCPPHFVGEATSHYQRRPEGLTVKHCVNGNSVKMYDKAHTLLRVETTINNPKNIKVYRPMEGDPSKKAGYRDMRKGIADWERRAGVSLRANTRYLDALAELNTDTPLAQILEPVTKRIKVHNAHYRALRPWTNADIELLQAINRPEYLISGFRNQDIAQQLFAGAQDTLPQRRAASARTSYRLRLLKAHGIIKKLPKTRRYKITQKGTQLATALLLAQFCAIHTLLDMAA
jgi:hypothetical protein